MLDAFALMFALTREPEAKAETRPEPASIAPVAGPTPPPPPAPAAPPLPFTPEPGLFYRRDRWGLWHSSPNAQWLETWVGMVNEGRVYRTPPAACPTGNCPR